MAKITFICLFGSTRVCQVGGFCLSKQSCLCFLFFFYQPFFIFVEPAVHLSRWGGMWGMGMCGCGIRHPLSPNDWLCDLWGHLHKTLRSHLELHTYFRDAEWATDQNKSNFKIFDFSDFSIRTWTISCLLPN